MLGIYGGSLRASIGRELHFGFSLKDSSGAEMTWGGNSATSVSYSLALPTLNNGGFDFVDIANGSTAISLEEVTVSNVGLGLWRTPRGASSNIYTVSASDFSRGDRAILMLQVMHGGGNAVYYFNVDITEDEAIEQQLAAGLTDTEAENLGTNSDTLIGRLYTLERNQLEVLMPRLKRALGLLGEYQHVDGFVYDDDGNITQCRVRLFRNDAEHAAAQLWTDTINDNDPQPDASAVTGELARYHVSVSNLLPRNLRTLYRQEPEDEPGDKQYGELGSDAGGSVL